MKIRLGHVTNSSSSSYIVAIDKQTPDSDSTEGFMNKNAFATVAEMVSYYGSSFDTTAWKRAEKNDWQILEVTLGGDGSYDDGEIAFLLKQGGIRKMDEIKGPRY